MERAVEDELITLRPDILAVEQTDNAEQPFDALVPEATPLDDTARQEVQLVSDNDGAREGASIYLTRGLKLSDLSPRHRILDLDKNDLLPQQQVVDDIEAKEMIGQEISLGSIKAVIEAVNESKEQEYELSRPCCLNRSSLTAV